MPKDIIWQDVILQQHRTCEDWFYVVTTGRRDHRSGSLSECRTDRSCGPGIVYRDLHPENILVTNDAWMIRMRVWGILKGTDSFLTGLT